MKSKPIYPFIFPLILSLIGFTIIREKENDLFAIDARSHDRMKKQTYDTNQTKIEVSGCLYSLE